MFESVDARTHGRTDGRKLDGNTCTLSPPDEPSGELNTV